MERAARDGAAVGVIVGVERAEETRVGRRSLCQWPPIVGACGSRIDLFPGVLADIVDEHRPRQRLKRERERIAQPERPDGAVRSDGRVHERIVRGDGSIRVDPQHLPESVRQGLGVGRHRVLADRDVQLAVGAEVNGAAIVIGGAERFQVEQNNLAAGDRDIPIGGEPADAVVDVRRGGGVVDVHESIDRESRIERDAEQTPLACGADRQRHERRRQQRSVLDDAQRSALLADEQPAIGRKRHCGGSIQAPGDDRLDKPLRQRGRGCRMDSEQRDGKADDKATGRACRQRHGAPPYERGAVQITMA